MAYYVGLDVSLEATSVCVLAEDGTVVAERKVATEPEALIDHLRLFDGPIARLGLEAGPLSQWLHASLVEAGLPAICVETRRMKTLLSAERVKTDRSDARGIARMMRVGLFKAVHVKSRSSQEQRAFLTSRSLLLGQRKAIENDLRGLLRNFGCKVGQPGVAKGAFAARVRELVADYPALSAVAAPLLQVHAEIVRALAALDRRILAAAKADPVCRRLMSVPGVGPMVALSFRTGVDDPTRFRRSSSVGAHFGLTPTLYQSGEVERLGRVSRAGDAMVRSALYNAAHILLTKVRHRLALREWALRLAERRGRQVAKVALARRLAVILYAMWVGGTDFRDDPVTDAMRTS